MLVGGHVSSSGGLVKSYERGVEFGCDALQIFNQSPRMWRPTQYKQDDIDEFRSRMASGPIKSVVIHAVYLINAASKDREIRKKSLTSLAHALQVGDAIGADGVVFHPGSTVGEPLDEAIERVGEAIRQVLGESESCPLLLEDTAGAGGTIGRDFHELARLIELGGGGKRLGVCLDSCHMFASGYDISTADKLASVIDECVSIVGLERVQCLHVNDSKVALGSNRDRHDVLPEGELGTRGLSAFLSEPRFEGLPALLETKLSAEQVAIAKDLRKKGLAARKRRESKAGKAKGKAKGKAAG
jgi:deoxyribonuclease-4